jgi:glutaredoxin
MAHKIEVFTAGCPLCLDTMKAVKEATKECDCEVIERRCEGTECCEPAKDYDIKAVPSIVVDGKIACVGKLSAEELKQYI